MTPKIVDGQISPDALGYHFQFARFANVGTAQGNVSFERAFADTPVVIVTPAIAITWARVVGISPSSFSWLADVAGSAHWFAYGRR